MPKHIGIVGVTSEGAALCYRTICQEGEAQQGYAHPEVTLHNLSLADYMRAIEAEDWLVVGHLLLESATKLASIGAAFAICPDNTAHQGLRYVVFRSTLRKLWLRYEDQGIQAMYAKLKVTQPRRSPSQFGIIQLN